MICQPSTTRSDKIGTSVNNVFSSASVINSMPGGLYFSGHSLDAPLAWQQTNSNRSLLKMVTGEAGQPERTLREVFHPVQGLGRQKTFVGSGSSVAGQLAQWLQESDTDDINLAQWFSPGCFEDFARWVIPELKHLGLSGNPTEPLTQRQRLFPEGGAEPAADHPSQHNG